MDIRKRIDKMLNKIKSEDKLKRIYEFIKYIYIYSNDTDMNAGNTRGSR